MPHKAKHKQLQRKEKKRNVAPPVQQIPTPSGTSPATISQTGTNISKPKTGTQVQSIAAMGILRHPYMVSEMKWIGIIAGTVIVILIILALVLPRFIS